MKRYFEIRKLDINVINERAKTDVDSLILEESERYDREVKNLARHLASKYDNHCLVMLSGPSSAGKTTTSLKLTNYLKEFDIDAHTISMDDFYRGREQAPILENGNYDYEALEALRLDKLEQCMRELINEGRTMLPRFDFHNGKPFDEMHELVIKPNSFVIFEGIHAVNPYFEQHLPSSNLFKVFINTVSPFMEGDIKLVARRDIRLIRRMIRDEKFRNSPIVNTLHMWQQVVRGENEYMFPFVDSVDYLIDTTHAYEPCVFAPIILPMLKSVPSDSEFIDTVNRITEILSCFESIPLDKMPDDALLREFVGR
jgi:uridine kinase